MNLDDSFRDDLVESLEDSREFQELEWEDREYFLDTAVQAFDAIGDIGYLTYEQLDAIDAFFDMCEEYGLEDLADEWRELYADT